MASAVTQEDFENEVINSEKPVLVDFWAAWCGPCRMISPIVDEIAEENPNIKVVKINVDEEPELAAQFDIMSIPSLLAFKNGKLENRMIGVHSKEEILSCFSPQSSKSV